MDIYKAMNNHFVSELATIANSSTFDTTKLLEI